MAHADKHRSDARTVNACVGTGRRVSLVFMTGLHHAKAGAAVEM